MRSASERSETRASFHIYLRGSAVRTYIPTSVVEVHKLAKFLARYQSVLRPAVVAVDAAYGAVFDDLLAAVLAWDAIAQTIYPLEE